MPRFPTIQGNTTIPRGDEGQQNQAEPHRRARASAQESDIGDGGEQGSETDEKHRLPSLLRLTECPPCLVCELVFAPDEQITQRQCVHTLRLTESPRRAVGRIILHHRASVKRGGLRQRTSETPVRCVRTLRARFTTNPIVHVVNAIHEAEIQKWLVLVVVTAAQLACPVREFMHDSLVPFRDTVDAQANQPGDAEEERKEPTRVRATPFGCVGHGIAQPKIILLVLRFRIDRRRIRGLILTIFTLPWPRSVEVAVCRLHRWRDKLGRWPIEPPAPIRGENGAGCLRPSFSIYDLAVASQIVRACFNRRCCSRQCTAGVALSPTLAAALAKINGGNRCTAAHVNRDSSGR
mmetsp:Transcript_21131/g.60364  ORF Transcript_21131/g.60364 Transcript_21131/m.60364 type:complete len:350 (-) Transcript_21131:270-1319(-)